MSCRLCLGAVRGTEAWNEPLFESSNFVVLPSLGALIEGWLLLVPKEHFICMGALPESVAAEMQEMKNMLCSFAQQCFGQVCAFEHGPTRPNCSVGCSVDHAHLHIVPTGIDLRSAVTPFLPENARWSEAGLQECRAAFERGEDYLYLEQPIGAGRISTHSEFGSQLFRRAIADSVGVSSQFNWRQYPQHANVLATIARVRSWEGGVLSCQTLSEVAA